jgi:hypothetical protein
LGVIDVVSSIGGGCRSIARQQQRPCHPSWKKSGAAANNTNHQHQQHPSLSPIRQSGKQGIVEINDALFSDFFGIFFYFQSKFDITTLMKPYNDGLSQLQFMRPD